MNALNLEAITITDLHPNPHNPRYDLGDTTELTESIAQIGIIQPLTVTTDPEGGYMIVAGHRRHAAAQAAGLETVPCVITASADADTAAAMVHENHHRNGLTNAEYARGVQGMLDAGWDITATAKGLGLKTKTVKTLKAAAHTSEDVRGLLHAGSLTLDESLALADIEHVDADLYAATRDAITAGGANASWKIRQARETIGKREARIQADALSAETGVPVLDEVDRWSGNTETLTDPTDHAGLKCYALYATCDREGNPHVEHWCINIRAHRNNATTGTDGEVDEAARAERRRVINNNKAWDGANDVRAAWIADSLKTRTTIPKKHLVDVLALNLARPYDQSHVREAIRIVTGAQHTGWMSADERAKATAGDNARIRTHLLATVISYEERMSKTIWRENRQDFHTYLQLLHSLGYTPTPPEAEYVNLANCGDDPATGHYAQQ